MDVLGLIPARGGSKGIPRKNLAPVAGKPLVAWTVEAARAARELTRVVVSTDDDEIAAAAGVEVLRRPEAIAADDTPMFEVIRHAADELRPDVVVLLQPTSPLRRAGHVDEAVRLLLDTGADSVVSVVEVPHRYGPESLMDVVEGRLVARSDVRTRQGKERVYARNGPAILAVRADRLGDDLYAGDCRPYVMDERDSLDVDTPFELELADLLLRAR
ncbi:MAG TPA: acylneuraminate cytidylyltransferase family protein [Gaiellaceae bacterium]|jgi:CMP-N-acetylneuraminic acid synthetase|nr:acylneuraminate cytidylyltransferase family protein [Gaiellaceae bacterium]